MKKVLAVLVGMALGTAALAATGTQAPAGSGELPLAGVYGGELVDPVIVGDLVYVASGRVLSAWNYADPAAPVQVSITSMTPASGTIRGLTRWGDYLYASWQAGDDSGGVAVYSLRDPQRPELVNEFSDYAAPSYKNLWTLAAANGYLYLFDAENGIYYGDLEADALHPTFTRLLRTPIPYVRSQVDGDHIYISGTTYSSTPVHVCAMLDVATPSAPAFVDGNCGNGDPLENFRSRIQAPLAAAFGLRFSLYDIGNPAAVQTLGSIETLPATDGFLAGNHAYSLGFSGIDIHDISDPLAPKTVGSSPIMTLGADSVTALPDGALVLTSTDRFTRLDVSADPLDPVEVSTVTPRGGTVPRDIELVNGKAFILQENYGLTKVDPVSFEVINRFDANLPEALNQRDFEQFAVDGGRAYLGAWGYGLIIADLSFDRPFELGRLEFPYVSTVAASGDFAYLGTTTNGGILQVVDVSVPAKPVLRGSLALPTINRLQVHGHYVYAADELAGIHIVDVSDPDQPVEVQLWNDGCADLGGYTARDIELNAAGSLAVVGCPTGLHILDLSRPASPTRVGGYAAEWAAARVAIEGDRAWYADANGLKAFDISTPSAPVLVGEASLAGFSPRRVRAIGDGRVAAFGTTTGMHVFGEIDVVEPPADRLFADGFDVEPPAGVVSHYDDLTEGGKGTSFQYNGVTYREVNEVHGYWPGPEHEPFVPGSWLKGGLGNEFIIEDSTYLLNDFPNFASSPNMMTFGAGELVIAGGNLNIGPLASAWLDLDEVATAANVKLAYYENGPWGGISIHLDAYRNGVKVGGTLLTITSNDPNGRDNVTTNALSLGGAEFDSLHLYSQLDGEFTAPRVMIDDLRLTPAAR